MPKSMTKTGPPYNSYAATASTIRSAPICCGFGVAIRMPVLMPASTIIGLILKYFIRPFCSECMIFGTTEQMIASCMSSIPTWFLSSRLLRSMPYSSDVRGILVVILKLAFILSPSNTPHVMFVFPTSSAKIICYSSSSPSPKNTMR